MRATINPIVVATLVAAKISFWRSKSSGVNWPESIFTLAEYESAKNSKKMTMPITINV